MRRREFLTRSAQVALLTTPGLVPGLVPGARAETRLELDAADVETLDLLLDVLFPKGPDSPGARDIRASEYIQISLVDPDIDLDERTFLRDGFGKLDRFSKERFEAAFRKIAPGERARVVDAFVSDGGGERWIAGLLSYVLEALLGDPSYGVNVNEVGWKWIDHKPGYPRPPKPKWYRAAFARRGV